jgi:hypothetical protein
MGQYSEHGFWWCASQMGRSGGVAVGRIVHSMSEMGRGGASSARGCGTHSKATVPGICTHSKTTDKDYE